MFWVLNKTQMRLLLCGYSLKDELERGENVIVFIHTFMQQYVNFIFSCVIFSNKFQYWVSEIINSKNVVKSETH